MIPGDSVTVDDGSLIIYFDKRRASQIRLRFVGKSHKVRLCRIKKQREEIKDGKEKSDEKTKGGYKK